MRPKVKQFRNEDDVILDIVEKNYLRVIFFVKILSLSWDPMGKDFLPFSAMTILQCFGQ